MDRLAQYILDNFEYDRETGDIINLTNRGGRAYAGYNVYTRPSTGGYLQFSITVDGQKRLVHAHRAAWLIHYKKWPDNQIDHINRVKTDNRLENLRDVSPRDNVRNSSRVSRYGRGVTRKKHGKFEARISYRGKYVYLGTFGTPQEAAVAYLEACEKYGENRETGSIKK